MIAEENALIDEMTDGIGCKLTTISELQKKKIMSGEWEHLEVGRVTEISPQVARIFASSKLVSLSFPDLEHLSIDVARELSIFNGYELEFPSLREISDELAKTFSEFQVRSLSFESVACLSDQAALNLSKFGHPYEYGNEILSFYHCPMMSETARKYLEASPAFSDGDAIRKASGISAQ